MLNEMEFKLSNFDFEISAANYMKFNIHDMDLKRLSEDNILVKQGEKIKSSDEAVETIAKQFEFYSDDSALTKDSNTIA